MDLHVDNLLNNTISLAHNGKQNGDVMADPDMQVWIHPDHKEAEAMTFQNDYLGIFQEVYPEPGKYRPKLKKDLNDFLADWLKTIIEVQQYKLVAETEELIFFALFPTYISLEATLIGASPRKLTSLLIIHPWPRLNPNYPEKDFKIRI